MAGRTGRTRRPNGVSSTTRFSCRLSDEALVVAERAAEALGITREYFLEELLLKEGQMLPETGRPEWWSKPLPKDQEVLPLKSA
jgi:hypothetical protein